jgi:hypothetical protein
MWFFGWFRRGRHGMELGPSDSDDDLATLLQRNTLDAWQHTFGIGEGINDASFTLVAYSVPDAESEMQPIYVLEPDLLPLGRRFTVRFVSPRTETFVTELAPERDNRIPMAATSVMGATYPAELARITEHFRDSSWKNDVTDSIAFGAGGKPYMVWVQPASLIERLSDGPPSRYEITELEYHGDLVASLDEREIDYDADTVQFDDPVDLLEYVRSIQPVDATAERFRLLDLGPKRRLYREGEAERLADSTAQRFALLDPYEDDPTVNPSRRRARRNPDDIAAAREKYEEFHRHKPKKIWEGKSIIPAKVRLLGKAKAVLYRSDKNDPDTGRAVKKPINYIHDHDAGVKAYTPAVGGDVDVPSFIKDVEAVVVLGKCLGFDFEDDGRTREAKGIRPYPDLCATPCGKALLVIQDRREVLAIIWGGGLGVEARGIVG